MTDVSCVNKEQKVSLIAQISWRFILAALQLSKLYETKPEGQKYA
jgi:hypothetical protein